MNVWTPHVNIESEGRAGEVLVRYDRGKDNRKNKVNETKNKIIKTHVPLPGVFFFCLVRSYRSASGTLVGVGRNKRITRVYSRFLHVYDHAVSRSVSCPAYFMLTVLSRVLYLSTRFCPQLPEADALCRMLRIRFYWRRVSINGLFSISIFISTAVAVPVHLWRTLFS